jgi:hypothetical protein
MRKQRRLADPLKPTQEHLRFIADFANKSPDWRDLVKRARRLFPGYVMGGAVVYNLADGPDRCHGWLDGYSYSESWAFASEAVETWIYCLVNGHPITLPVAGLSSVHIRASKIAADGSLNIVEQEAPVEGTRDFLSSYVAPLLLNAKPFPFTVCLLCGKIALRQHGALKFCGREWCLKKAEGATSDREWQERMEKDQAEKKVVTQ